MKAYVQGDSNRSDDDLDDDILRISNGRRWLRTYTEGIQNTDEH